jgi:hypothetical protein
VVSVARLKRRRTVSAAGIARRRYSSGQWLRVVVVLLEIRCKQHQKHVREMHRKKKRRMEPEGGLGSSVLTGMVAGGRRRLRGLELHGEQPGGASVELREGKCGGGRVASYRLGLAEKRQGIQWD